MLTDTTIRALKPTEKSQKLFDSGGLFLFVPPTGGRLWRFKYRHAGREKLISLGRYPLVTLKQARERRDAARRLLANGVDPSAKRKAEKFAQADTFEAVAREHLSLQHRAASATIEKALQRLIRHVFPYLGNRSVATITAPDLLAVLRRIEGRGAHDLAHWARSMCGRVFRYAIATGRAERDVAADLRGALAPVVVTNHAAITEPARISELLRAIDTYRGQPATEYALKLAPLVFVRPGELRKAQWSEFDLDVKGPEWRIPSERMKMREAHIVPLARQVVTLLRELYQITGSDGYVFPSLRTRSRPLSENTINFALRGLGYSGDEMTGHGFRSMASTRLNELGWNPEIIELQLAHKERNQVRAAYNRAERLAERRRMMQAWADYLDSLKIGSSVVPIRREA